MKTKPVAYINQAINLILNHCLDCKHNLFFLILVLLGVIIQIQPLILTSLGEAGFLIGAAHDSLWHLSLMAELNRQFPPTNPAFGGELLSNYHYASDWLWLTIGQSLNLEAWVVYYRVAPILVSLFYNLMVVLLVKQWIKSFKFQIVAVILISLSGSWGYLTWMYGLSNAPSGNVFMLDQPVEMLTNVHTYLGFGLFICVLFLIKAKTPKFEFLKLISIGTLVGLTFSIKAYAALVLLFALGLTWIIRSLATKKINKLIWALVPGAIITLILILITTRSSQGLIWDPGWILLKLVSDSDRLSGFKFTIPYLSVNTLSLVSQIKFSLILLVLVPVYLLGNLGIRVFSFLLVKDWIKKPTRLTTDQLLLISVMIGSLVTPLLFRQGATPYNIVQFGPYGLMVSSLLTGIWLEQQSKLATIKISSLMAIILLSLPTTLFWSYQTTVEKIGSYSLSTAQYDGLKYLRHKTAADSLVLTDPDTIHRSLMLVPGLAERRSYYSGEVFGELTGLETSDRLAQSKNFFDLELSTSQMFVFLDSSNVDYVYLDHKSAEMADRLIDLGLPLVPVYNNQEVIILKVEK